MKTLAQFILLHLLLWYALPGAAQRHYVNFQRLGLEQQLTLSSIITIY